jgi:hypothetical protein
VGYCTSCQWRCRDSSSVSREQTSILRSAFLGLPFWNPFGCFLCLRLVGWLEVRHWRGALGRKGAPRVLGRSAFVLSWQTGFLCGPSWSDTLTKVWSSLGGRTLAVPWCWPSLPLGDQLFEPCWKVFACRCRVLWLLDWIPPELKAWAPTSYRRSMRRINRVNLACTMVCRCLVRPNPSKSCTTGCTIEEVILILLGHFPLLTGPRQRGRLWPVLGQGVCE